MTDGSSKARLAATVGLLGITAVGPVLYPAWLALRTRRVPDALPPEPNHWPGVTVVVPSYRERHVIAAKVSNILDNGYPGPLEVLVVADDPETSAAARGTSARVIEGSERRGKAAALNCGVREASMPVVVLTDANAMIESGGIEKLVRWLEDPRVGAVAGEKRVVTTSGERLYWAFESWLKRRENRTGGTVGLCGELVALRRDDYRELPADLIGDDLWLALDVVEEGKRVVYECGACVREEASASVGMEWRRRTRIICGAIDVLSRRPKHLVPGRSPVAWQLWGHRLVRSSFGPIAHAGLVCAALGAVRRKRVARVFLAVHAVGVAAVLREDRGANLTTPERLLGHALFLQAAGLGGTLRWLRRDRPVLWQKEERVPTSGRGE